jgi:hypothetical protein
MPPDSPDHRAPDGAHCAEHPDRAAHFTCPRCGSYACLPCWHPSVSRCQQCLNRDPTEAAPPLPWEREGVSLPVRFFATLATALRPVRSAPAFAHDNVPAALRFLLLSVLPLALLAGVIPHTRTLLFEGDFRVKLVGHPSSVGIALDVARAGLVEVGLTAVQLGCLLLPFLSLVRAYAHPQRKHAALRVLCYRMWLLPAALLFFYLAVWALPTPDPALLQQTPPMGWLLVLSVRLLGTVLLILAMSATARLACGLGPWMSMVVVMVPVMLLLLVEPLATLGAERLLPVLQK